RVSDGTHNSASVLLEDGTLLSANQIVEVDAINPGIWGNSITVSVGPASNNTVTSFASATFTVGGAPAAGNTISFAVNGVSVTYTVVAGDTTATVTTAVTALINNLFSSPFRNIITATNPSSTQIKF